MVAHRSRRAPYCEFAERQNLGHPSGYPSALAEALKNAAVSRKIARGEQLLWLEVSKDPGRRSGPFSLRGLSR